MSDVNNASGLDSQEAVVIFFALKRFSKEDDSVLPSYHLGTRHTQDGGYSWAYTTLGDFDARSLWDVTAVAERLRTSFNLSHPVHERDARVLVSTVDVHEIGGNRYAFTVKWRLMADTDIIFQQTNFARVKLENYITDIEKYPAAQPLLEGSMAPLVQELIESELNATSPDSVAGEKKYHLKDDLGINKSTVKDRFEKHWDIAAEENQSMVELMENGRTSFTLDELEVIARYLVPEAYQKVVDEYYSQTPPKFTATLTSLHLKSAEDAIGQSDHLMTFVDARRFEQINWKS